VALATARPADLEKDLARLRRLLEDADVEGARALARSMTWAWPDDPVVREYAKVLAPPVFLGRRPASGRSLVRERRWLAEHGHEHPGCWLAVSGDKLVAADSDLSQVLEAIRNSPEIVDPLVRYQPGTA